MSAKTQAFFFSLTAILVLLISAVNPLTAYADSGVGPNPAPPPPETHTPKPPAPPPNLSNVPQGTQVSVINHQGHKIPLGTNTAANAIDNSDPIWCPAGQSPTPGSGGCTAPFNSFNKLLNYLKTNQGSASYQQAGTIYVEMGNYGGGETSINFNLYGLTSLTNYDLTIQGGWNTSNNTINTTVGTAFNIPLSIGTSANPWVGSITLNDIQIQNVNNATALTVYSQNNVILSDVQINNNSTGANIAAGGETTVNNSQFNHNKKAGAIISSSDDVNISNSSFNNNGANYSYNGDGKGLSISSNGNVTLANVAANQNLTYGANIQNSGSVFISNSFFSGNIGYTDPCGCIHGGYGLQVVTPGSIYVDSTTASNNLLYGATLSGLNVAVSNSVFDSNGVNSKSSSGEGLQINASASASLNNVEADNNNSFGTNIQAGGAVSIENGFFSGNLGYTDSCGYTTGGYGLQVSAAGDISLGQVTASNNYTYGALLSGSNAYVLNSIFDNNGLSNNGKNSQDRGLKVSTSGETLLENVEANNNQLYGAIIQAGNVVSIENSLFSGNLGYTDSCGCTHGGYGLQVTALGDISLNQVTASNNYYLGASLNGADVSVSNSIFDNNGSGSSKNIIGKGLQIVSNGNVSLSSVESNNNQVYGTSIQAGTTVAISNSFFSGNAAYSYTPCKGTTATGNGLLVTATQDIFLSQVTASDNGSDNAILNGSSDVFVINSIFNNSKSGNGITINVSGQVTLQGITADGNNRTGAYIAGNCVTNINVIGGDYSNNQHNGLRYINSILNLSGSPTFNNDGGGGVLQQAGMCDN